MRTIDLIQPGWIALGPGCARRCLGWLEERGKLRLFIVTSPETRPLAEAIFAGRGQAEMAIYDGIQSEPDFEAFDATLRAARSFSPDAVVGVGGGSVLDVAKLVAGLYAGGQAIEQVLGSGLLAGRALTLVCVPTTAGTGSEVSPNAILLDRAARQKRAVISPWLIPDAAFVDAELMIGLPPAITASTGLDALTHCIETYANRHAHPAVDLFALEGIRLIGAHLERAVRNGGDLDAREALARASLYGGLCLGPVNTAAVHALAYALAGEFGIPHGLSNALLLVPVLRFNLDAAQERYADIALALGAAPQTTTRSTALAGLDRLEALCRAVGVPPGLGALGIPREAIPGMAESALTVTRLLRNNPREVSRADAEAIYQAAYGA